MIFMLISDGKKESKAEKSQHKSNLVTAIALICKRETDAVKRSFILSTASGFQIPITDSSSDGRSLSTFSLTTSLTSEIKMESF